MGRVDGKVALVTGAASGLGEADARLLAREGAKVVVTTRKKLDEGRMVVEEILTDGGEATFIKLDVTKESDQEIRQIKRGGEQCRHSGSEKYRRDLP